MKTMISMCVVLLSMTVAAWSLGAQNSQQSGSQSQSTGQNTQSGKSADNQNQTMVGKVSSDAKNFTNSSDSKNYKVDNPNTLQSSEGQNVAVLVHVDPDTGTIHVLQLEPTQEMSGKVSADDKTFVNDNDSKSYNVSNPDALKGHEGQHVALVVHIDPDTGDLHITQVEMPPQHQ